MDDIDIPASKNVAKFVYFISITLSADSCPEENNDPPRLRRVLPNREDG